LCGFLAHYGYLIYTQRKGESKMSDDIFDFGFTAVDETELEAVQKATTQVEEVSSTATTTQDLSLSKKQLRNWTK
jgi:hypothetical protein